MKTNRGLLPYKQTEFHNNVKNDDKNFQNLASYFSKQKEASEFILFGTKLQLRSPYQSKKRYANYYCKVFFIIKKNKRLN